MLLRDFDIGRFGEGDATHLNRRVAHIAEQLRYRVCAQPRLEAPFAKVFVNLLSPGSTAAARVVLGVAQVPVDFQHEKEHAPYPVFRSAVVDALDAARVLLRDKLGWQHERLESEIAELRASCEPRFRTRLGLSRVDKRTGRWVDVFYEIDEERSSVQATVYDSAGVLVHDTIVARHDVPVPMDLVFPAARSRFKGDSFVLLDRGGTILASVPAPIRG